MNPNPNPDQVDRKARQKRWEAKQKDQKQKFDQKTAGKGGRGSTKAAAAGKPKLSPSKGIQASRYD